MHVHEHMIIIPCRCSKHYTPLACAAKAGNHSIVTYLLSIKGVSVEGVAIEDVIPHDNNIHAFCFQEVKLSILHTYR